MAVIDDILKELDFDQNEIKLYEKIRWDVFFKDSETTDSNLVSKILDAIDQEYSE